MFVPLVTALLQVVAGVGGAPGNQQLQAPASATADKDKCVVSGRVLSMQTGEPLKKANLQLILQMNGRRGTTQYQMTGYSASVLFIPEDLTLNGGSVRTERTNQNGAFVSEAMQPGTCYVLAFDLDEYRGFDDPAVLKQLVSKGTKIELKENDKQQLPLTLLAAEDLQAALAVGAGN